MISDSNSAIAERLSADKAALRMPVFADVGIQPLTDRVQNLIRRCIPRAGA